MKHTKKMIMVPETEYYALMSMLKRGAGGDPLEGERALLDAKIQKNLSDPKTTAELKAQRHSWLYKRRNQLKELVENRPQKVIIEDPQAIPNVAPYLGIQRTKARLEAVDNEMEKKKRFKKPSKRAPLTFSNGSSYYSSATDNTNGSTLTEEEDEEEEQGTPKQQHTPTHVTPKRKLLTNADKTSPRNFSKIMGIITKDPEKYGIEKKTGRVMTNFNKPIERSDYVESVKYMTGQQMATPRGHSFFLQRLSKNPEITKFFKNIYREQEQSGEGKRKKHANSKRKQLVWVKQKTIKTPGLKREHNKTKSTANNILFKPKLWAKL